MSKRECNPPGIMLMTRPQRNSIYVRPVNFRNVSQAKPEDLDRLRLMTTDLKFLTNMSDLWCSLRLDFQSVV